MRKHLDVRLTSANKAEGRAAGTCQISGDALPLQEKRPCVAGAKAKRTRACMRRRVVTAKLRLDAALGRVARYAGSVPLLQHVCDVEDGTSCCKRLGIFQRTTAWTSVTTCGCREGLGDRGLASLVSSRPISDPIWVRIS